MKVAQFVYLMLSNKDIREVIDSITSKAVLILGRSTPEHKRLLNCRRSCQPSVPVRPLLMGHSGEAYSIFEHLQRYPWMLPIHSVRVFDHLMTTLNTEVIQAAQRKRQELMPR